MFYMVGARKTLYMEIISYVLGCGSHPIEWLVSFFLRRDDGSWIVDSTVLTDNYKVPPFRTIHQWVDFHSEVTVQGIAHCVRLWSDTLTGRDIVMLWRDV